jgi:hypothetical protein
MNVSPEGLMQKTAPKQMGCMNNSARQFDPSSTFMHFFKKDEKSQAGR